MRSHEPVARHGHVTSGQHFHTLHQTLNGSHQAELYFHNTAMMRYHQHAGHERYEHISVID